MSAPIYHRRASAWIVVVLAWTVVLGLGQSTVDGRQSSVESRQSTVEGLPVLWRDPQPIAERDLFWGSGSEGRVPQAPFTFQEEVTSGTQLKVVVIDARGVIWDVKFGQEGHADVAANRLVWALGYLVEEMYFVRDGTIQGAKDLKRAAEHVGADGRFQGARFRRRNPDMVRTDTGWAFNQNPFVGSEQLSGLIILMTMINNWDIDGTRNNQILNVAKPDGSMERWYIVSDLGATFGRMGGRLTNHSKWDVADFEAEGFLEEVDEDAVELDYDGLDRTLHKVPLAHARWFGSLAGQLGPAQVRRAFEAAGATAEEVDGFSRKFSAKIAELQAAVRPAPSARQDL